MWPAGDQTNKSSLRSPALSLEEREAAYQAARERIFSDVPHSADSLLDQRETQRARPVPVVARRMIAHALGKPQVLSSDVSPNDAVLVFSHSPLSLSFLISRLNFGILWGLCFQYFVHACTRNSDNKNNFYYYYFDEFAIYYTYVFFTVQGSAFEDLPVSALKEAPSHTPAKAARRMLTQALGFPLSSPSSRGPERRNAINQNATISVEATLRHNNAPADVVSCATGTPPDDLKASDTDEALRLRSIAAKDVDSCGANHQYVIFFISRFSFFILHFILILWKYIPSSDCCLLLKSNCGIVLFSNAVLCSEFGTVFVSVSDIRGSCFKFHYFVVVLFDINWWSHEKILVLWNF